MIFQGFNSESGRIPGPERAGDRAIRSNLVEPKGSTRISASIPCAEERKGQKAHEGRKIEAFH
jgi:hypothetical protein